MYDYRFLNQMLTNKFKFLLEEIIWNQIGIKMKSFNAQFKDVRCSTSNVSTATSSNSDSLLRRWGKSVLYLFIRILFTIMIVVIVLTRPAHSTIIHRISNDLHIAEPRSLNNLKMKTDNPKTRLGWELVHCDQRLYTLPISFAMNVAIVWLRFLLYMTSVTEVSLIR
jgi:hypothetical protein